MFKNRLDTFYRCRLLDYWTWEKVRVVFTTRFLKIAYAWLLFVPVVVNVLSQLPKEVSPKIAEEKLKLILTLPFSWSCFYFSALLFIVAYSVYLWKCPYFIKAYASSDEFFQKEKDKTLDELCFVFENLKWENGSNLLKHYIEERVRKHHEMVSVYENAQPLAPSIAHPPQDLQEHYEKPFREKRHFVQKVYSLFRQGMCEHKRLCPNYRFLCLFLLFLSIMLFAFPLFQNFYYVIQYLFLSNR